MRPLAQILKQTIVDFAPNHLKPYIKVFLRQSGETTLFRVEVDRGENHAEREGSDDARAQEFGSGLQAQIGETGYIRFAARNAEALVFPGTNDWRGKTIWMPYPRKVNHPGIEAANQGKGYIRPAISEFEGTILPQVDSAFKDEVEYEFRITFGHAKRK